eukprot:1184954-Prorocentrum_minimum.AAC.2
MLVEQPQQVHHERRRSAHPVPLLYPSCTSHVPLLHLSCTSPVPLLVPSRPPPPKDPLLRTPSLGRPAKDPLCPHPKDPLLRTPS